MAAFPAKRCPHLVDFSAARAQRRLGTVEELGVEVGHDIALAANHLLEATVKLDSQGPGSLAAKRHTSLE